VIGTSSFSITHLRCKAYDCGGVGFSANGFHDLTWDTCEAYDIDSMGLYSAGGIILGYRNTTTDQTTPVGNYKVINCNIHDIHWTTGCPSSHGIMLYGEGTRGYNPIVNNNTINGVHNRGIYVVGPADNTTGEIAYNTISNYGTCYTCTEPGVSVHDNTCM
jgi:hypothetical protein